MGKKVENIEKYKEQYLEKYMAILAEHKKMDERLLKTKNMKRPSGCEDGFDKLYEYEYELIKQEYDSDGSIFDYYGRYPAILFAYAYETVLTSLISIKCMLEVLPKGTLIDDLSCEGKGRYGELEHDMDDPMNIVGDAYLHSTDDGKKFSSLPRVHSYYKHYDYDFVCKLIDSVKDFTRRHFNPREDDIQGAQCTADELFLAIMLGLQDELDDYLGDTGYKFPEEDFNFIIPVEEREKYWADYEDIGDARHDKESWLESYDEDIFDYRAHFYYNERKMKETFRDVNIPYRLAPDSDYNIKNWFRNYYEE